MCEFYRRFVFSVKCICSKLLKGSKFRLISTFWTFFFANLITPVNCWKDQMWNAFTYVQHDYHNDSFFQLGILRDDEVFLVYNETFLASTLLLFSHTYFTICTKPSKDPLNLIYQVMQYRFEIVLHFKCDRLEVIFHMTKNGDPCICTALEPFMIIN